MDPELTRILPFKVQEVPQPGSPMGTAKFGQKPFPETENFTKAGLLEVQERLQTDLQINQHVSILRRFLMLILI